MGSISNSTAISGINEEALNNLVLDLNNDIDKIDFALRQIEMLFYDTEDFFKGEVADSVRAKFKQYSTQIEMLKKNLLSYPQDLLNLKNSIKNNDLESANIFDTYATDMSAEAKKTMIQ